jgi:hypothetical protein
MRPQSVQLGARARTTAPIIPSLRRFDTVQAAPVLFMLSRHEHERIRAKHWNRCDCERSHLTTSMPWAGVWFALCYSTCVIPSPQGIATPPVHAGSDLLRGVLARGCLPNLSHPRRRFGGLPTPCLPMLPRTRARVWTGGRAGPHHEYAAARMVQVLGYPQELLAHTTPSNRTPVL